MASPEDWRDECLYFFLPDRFSDETPADRALLDRRKLAEGRGGEPTWDTDAWIAWGESGRVRFGSGDHPGCHQPIGLSIPPNVTTIWLGPFCAQRRHSFVDNESHQADEYHGYAIQDFLEVDPRFGTRQDIVDLVQEAHDLGIRVIFDIIVNHTARNWLYKVNGQLVQVQNDPKFTGTVYDFGAWLDGAGRPMPAGSDPGPKDAVWPSELQDADAYHRMGEIVSWGSGDVDLSDTAEFRLADMTNRDLNLGYQLPTPPGRPPSDRVLDIMIACWTYWISLTDCDGFRIDTLKHISVEEARTFCGAIKEFAESVGKKNFLLAGEVAGSDEWENRYLEELSVNLDATLEINEARNQLRAAALDQSADTFLNRYSDPRHDPGPGSHRVAGSCFVTSIDDHDDIDDRQRFPGCTRIDPANDDGNADSYFYPLQAVPGAAMLLYTLGIPCLYYGTEQGMSGPALRTPWSLPGWLSPDVGGDRYLREAMFGPDHARPVGASGLPDIPGGSTDDPNAPGFGPFGTAGKHLFDEDSAVFRRVRAILAARQPTPRCASVANMPAPPRSRAMTPPSAGRPMERSLGRGSSPARNWSWLSTHTRRLTRQAHRQPVPRRYWSTPS